MPVLVPPPNLVPPVLPEDEEPTLDPLPTPVLLDEEDEEDEPPPNLPPPPTPVPLEEEGADVGSSTIPGS